ncbi:hypothetical protein ACGFNU_01960 [Spirillospora sp. NPDC048911]|uniref:hypothetical protein n=1 Tax=Spirillospora sp. NPDC048911 TaxID=3364527 RepID=UPI00371DCE9B
MTTPPERPSVDLGEQRAWIDALRKVDLELARLTEVRGWIVHRLQESMGDAEEARVDGRAVITWAWTKPATYLDRKALEDAHPEIAARFVRTKRPARPFRLAADERKAA